MYIALGVPHHDLRLTKNDYIQWYDWIPVRFISPNVEELGYHLHTNLHPHLTGSGANRHQKSPSSSSSDLHRSSGGFDMTMSLGDN